LRTAIVWGRTQGAKNLQWVGGEPTIHLPGILEAMQQIDDLPDVVWKSDFYATTEALNLLGGIVKYYVADFKFGNNLCAAQVAGVAHYVETITRNLKHVADRGILIIRHLLLPGHFECCYLPMINWIVEHLPDVRFSLRDGYLPKWQAKNHATLNALVSEKQSKMARNLAIAKGLRLV
jgi:putative pyruvate formate lyase activating enzyme